MKNWTHYLNVVNVIKVAIVVVLLWTGALIYLLVDTHRLLAVKIPSIDLYNLYYGRK